MKYIDRFQKVTVLGGGGKMGSGILLLTAMEMCNLSLDQDGTKNSFQLIAIDVSAESLRGLQDYFREAGAGILAQIGGVSTWMNVWLATSWLNASYVRHT